MIMLNKFLLVLLLLNFFLLLQQTRILSVSQVNPNLLLLGFLLLIFSGAKIWLVVLTAAAFVFMSIFFLPFWFLTILIFTALITAFAFFKKFLTGSRFIDFLITIFFATIIFSILIGIAGASPTSLGLILKEFLYNFIFGIFGWLIFFELFNADEKLQQT